VDYGKLNKEELIQICEENNLHYSSNMSKEDLERHIINNNIKTNNYEEDSFNKTSISKQNEYEADYSTYDNYETSEKNDGIGKTGAILNIIGSIFFLIIGFI